MSIRVGIGFDAHRLAPGRKLVLGGETIEYERGLEGHSDADVLLHALTDALLGAVAAPDIGSLFLASDPQWEGASSQLFLEKARTVAEEKGFRPQQVDVVVIAEAPKLSAYLPSIRTRLSEILGIPEDAVGLKATTTDGMGFTGRAEGIAVQAVVTVTSS